MNTITFDGISWPPLRGIQDGDYKLQRTKDALNILCNPHRQIKNIIHIAGTNGKGSVASFTSSVLKSNGYRCNVYTSPHLININERLKLNGLDISTEILAKYTKEVFYTLKKHNLHNSLTFFEAITVLMFYVFAKENADFNIIEVGLGGRFDATNIIENPLVSVITSISIDHQSYLGNTLAAIATEKCEIIKPNTNAVIGVQQNEDIYDIFAKKCTSVNASGVICRNVQHFSNTLDATYQAQNATLALKLLDTISQKLKIPFKDNSIEVISNTQWKGRMQSIFVQPIGKNIMVDCAHNIGGISSFLEYISKQEGSSVLIFGMLARKINEGITELIQQFLNAEKLNCVVTTNFHGEECIEATKLSNIINHENCKAYSGLEDAMTFAKAFDNIFLCGSIYMVGEFLEFASC